MNLKLLAKLEELNITTCEVRLPGCTNYMYLTPAHRHKRIYYKNRPELLWDIHQVIVACQSCHAKIEHDKELTELIFNQLRGEE